MLKKIAFSALGVLVLAATTEAGILSLLPSGKVSRLEDDDLETVIKAPGSTSPATQLDVGDFLLAVGKFPNFQNPVGGADIVPPFTDTTNMMMAVSLLKVLTKTTDGTGVTYFFEAPSAAEWAVVTANFTGPAPVVATGTTVLVYEDPPADPPVGGTHLVNTSVAATLAAATNGPLVYQFGFTSAPSTVVGPTFGYSAALEFQRAKTDTDNLLTISTLTFNGAYNLTAPIGPGGLALAGHNWLGSAAGGQPPAVRGLYKGPTQLQLQGGFGSIDTGSDLTPPSGWVIPTDTDAYLLPINVPEPGSLLMWAGFAAFGAIAGYRRRKTNSAV